MSQETPEARHTILLVDDEASIRDLGARILGSRYRVLTAPHADAGMEILRAEKIHLLITDQRMPGMTGVEFLQEAATVSPRTVRILATAYSDHQTVVDAINKGHVRRYLPKPWTSATLLAAVSHELERVDLIDRLETTVEQLRRRETELERALEEVRSVERMKDHLQANVSHELKTPLVAGMGYVELMLKGGLGETTGEQKRGLEIAFRNLGHLAHIIDDLMTYSRMRFGGEGIHPEPLDLATVVRTAVADGHWGRPTGQTQVRTDIPKDLPPVMADREKLTRLLVALLSNAEKFATDTPEIQVTARPAGRRVEVRISDNGQGIPPDHREFIFDRFRMGDETSTRRHGGVGIGLAMAKLIAEAHGTRLRIEDGERVVPSPGGRAPGTTLAFDLPLVLQTARGPENASTPRILVIDDDASTRDLVQAILGRTSYRVRCAASAREGREAFDQEAFDLVLCDLTLTDGSGMELARSMSGSGRGVPVYILSAHNDEATVEAAMDAGASGYISKPFRIDYFLTRVSEALLAMPGERAMPSPGGRGNGHGGAL